jgi:hypothetical protein
MNGRANVVAKTGKGELGSTRPAADRAPGLENENRPPGFSERDRGGEPVGAGPDDDRV